jgi:hypothetical protein
LLLRWRPLLLLLVLRLPRLRERLLRRLRCRRRRAPSRVGRELGDGGAEEDEVDDEDVELRLRSRWAPRPRWRRPAAAAATGDATLMELPDAAAAAAATAAAAASARALSAANRSRSARVASSSPALGSAPPLRSCASSSCRCRHMRPSRLCWLCDAVAAIVRARKPLSTGGTRAMLGGTLPPPRWPLPARVRTVCTFVLQQ